MTNTRVGPKRRDGRRPGVTRDNPIDIHVGHRIRLRRTLLGLSMDALAEALGVTYQQVQKYEVAGNRISASRLWDIAEILGVPVAYFYEGIPDAVAVEAPRLASVAGASPTDARIERDPIARRETLELVRAYMAIPSPEVRRRIAEFVRSLAEQPEAGSTTGASASRFAADDGADGRTGGTGGTSSTAPAGVFSAMPARAGG